MLCLAYQHGEGLGSGNDIDSGARLSTRCFHRARALVATEEEESEDLSDGLEILQEYLPLQLFAMM